MGAWRSGPGDPDQEKTFFEAKFQKSPQYISNNMFPPHSLKFTAPETHGVHTNNSVEFSLPKNPRCPARSLHFPMGPVQIPIELRPVEPDSGQDPENIGSENSTELFVWTPGVSGAVNLREWGGNMLFEMYCGDF